jgi:hypothetical protein
LPMSCQDIDAGSMALNIEFVRVSTLKKSQHNYTHTHCRARLGLGYAKSSPKS